ncbi:MAG: DUF4260 domain-containing protein [Chitinophagales bacterium]
MKNIIKLEELAVFVASIYLLYQLPMHLSWWLYLVLFFSPDIGMVGYLINTKVGAITYNLTHHKAVSLTVIAAGILMANDAIKLIGFIMLAHSAFDRVLGFGLKYPDNFKHTSVGNI